MRSIRVVRALVAAVEQAGIEREELLAGSELDSARLSDDRAFVEDAFISPLCERALDLTGDPALGLHWCERLEDSMFDPLSNMVAHAKNLRQALLDLRQFHLLLGESPIRWVESPDSVTFECLALPGASEKMQRLATEMMAFGMVRIVRSFNLRARLDEVNFAYERPGYHTEYTRLFGIEPRFGQPKTAIIFDRSVMSGVALRHDVEVHAAMVALAQRRIRELPHRTSLALRVRAEVVAQARTGRPTMNRVAHALGLSRRSLGRSLEAEGLTYKSILSEALAIVAKSYLCEAQLTVQETAYQMGFADCSAFHRAFKRWTGDTPSSSRASVPSTRTA